MISCLQKLPPVAGFPSVKSIWRAWHKLTQSQHLVEDALKAEFGRELFFAASGKAALYHLFRALRVETGKDAVGVAEYTCPDIAAAAIRAGMKVILLPLEPKTLEIDLQNVTEEQIQKCAAVVLSNLYGLLDSRELWSSRYPGLHLIDDASQALLSSQKAESEYGIVSFGRGKAICAVGGGAITGTREALSRLQLPHAALEDRRALVVRHYLTATSGRIFERPALFSIPASIPALHLGETQVQLDFSLEQMSTAQGVCALASLHERISEREQMVKKAQQWHERLAGLKIGEPFIARGFRFDHSIVPLRYPIILPTERHRDALLAHPRSARLGVSRSYPTPLDEFPSLRPMLSGRSTNAARDVSGRLLTLPVHRFVTEDTMEQTIRLFQTALT